MGQSDALEKLKSGEIAATVLIAGKPARDDQDQGGGRFRILPIATEGAARRLPAGDADHEDYPGLIAPGRRSRRSRSAVLIAFKLAEGHRPLYRRIQKFVDTFFPRLIEFRTAASFPWRERMWGRLHGLEAFARWMTRRF